MELSVVSTLYRSEAHLEEFYARVCAAAERLTPDFELVLVDDGSPDKSQELARDLCHRDPRVRLLVLSRNFGHHRAIMTGLADVTGDRVFLIDSDLEEAPESLAEFAERMEESGADVVYGVQTARKGGLFERLSGAIFYRAFNILSSDPIPRNLVTSRLMTGDYVRALVRHRDQEVFLAGLMAITGFHQIPMPVQKGRREGPSTYDLWGRMRLMVDAVTSFSSRPLNFIFWLGVSIMALSGVAGGYLLIQRLFLGRLLPGWASITVSVWFLGGLTMFALGVIGIYLSKIYAEVKRRPLTIVQARYGSGGPDGSEPPRT